MGMCPSGAGISMFVVRRGREGSGFRLRFRFQVQASGSGSGKGNLRTCGVH